MLNAYRRAGVGFALAVLVGLTAACGSGSDDSGASAAPGSAADAPAADAPAGDAPAAGGKADTSVSGTGMAGGCDATRKIFLALEAGDADAAKILKGKADALFEDVAATEATKNIDLAYDGASMASEMDYEFPEKKFLYQGNLAKQYNAVCVGKHDAEALPG